MTGRNLVVLCDGTSNEVRGNLTNVLKLYRIAEKDEEQVVFYHPGIGTIGLVNDWGRLRQKAAAVWGLATGWGLDDNILEAYGFLCRTYQEGDRIFLFGFSRGAYTARAVAGLIHLLGLLRPEQLNLARYALTAYKQAEGEDNLEIAWHFRRVIDGRRVPIHFLGVWDTVASVIVPRGRFSFGLAHLPYTKSNPSVRTFRQAGAIDEKRRMFRLYNWTPDQKFKLDPFAKSSVVQDQQTVWFSGDHSDVGGGYAEAESQAAKFPLMWLAREAEAFGLKLVQSMFDHLACGNPLASGKHRYVAPDATAPTHNSMRGFWPALEVVPKSLKWRRWPHKSTSKGIYFPLCEPRMIEDGSYLHRSVIDRLPTGYAPVNLPKVYQVADTRSPA